MNSQAQFQVRLNQTPPSNQPTPQTQPYAHQRQSSAIQQHGVQNQYQQQQYQEALSKANEKLKHQFQSFVRKLEATNSVKSRVQTIRDIDQFIQKKNQKFAKKQLQASQSQNDNGSFGNSDSSGNTNRGQISDKYEFPFCLSIIIIKIADLVLNPKDVKKDYKIDIDQLIMRCFFQQRCLVYKLPQFLLNFMEQYNDPQTKLAYIKFLTKEGLEVDPSFNTQLFIILLKLIDTSLKTPQYEILSFLKNILDYNPKAFTEPQTLSLLLRISLVGISSINQGQNDNSMEVCQILQYLLKYNDYSPKLLSASLLTMCVLSNREPFTFPIWNILKHIIIQDKKFIFQEILEILQIPLRCQYFEGKGMSDQQLTFQQAIKKEIQFKCFKESMNNMVIEFDDLQYSLSFHNQPTLYPTSTEFQNRQKNNPKMTIHELICRNKCDMKFYDISLWEDVQKIERLSQNAFAFDRNKLQDLINILQDDRNLWISTFEKNIDRVQKGAIFFVGKILWSQDRIDNINYPINQILNIFCNLINKKTKFNVISEIFGATKQLVLNNYQTLYFEWKGILQIMDQLTDYTDELVNKKRIDSIYEMFKIIRNQLLINRFPDFLENQAFKIYLKYKNQRVVMDKTLTQLAINYILNNDFMGSFQLVIESCLTKQYQNIIQINLFQYSEKSAEIRSLFLDMVSNFYEDCEDVNICTLLEAVFANNTEYFYLTRKDGSYTTAQIIQIIDMLVVMGCKTTKSTNFRHLTQILQECINCFEFDKSNLQNELNVSGFANIQQIKQNLLNKGTVNYLNSDQIKMKSFQSHALTRIIQLFILKSQTVEYEKSIYVFNILLTTLKLQSNDRRVVICNELLFNLKVNTYKELCWQTTDNPIFVDIQKQNIDLNDTENRSQSDSQNNSSGGSSSNSAHRYSMLFKGSRDSSQTQIGRSSLNKLLEEKYVIQNTLKSLISCIEDETSSSEIKLLCLKLFQRFMVYLQEDDFLNLELLEHDQQLNKQALKDGKSEWIKMVHSLLAIFDPIEEPEYSFVILEILQILLSHQNYHSAYPILTLQLHQLIIEQITRSISYSQTCIAKYQEQEFMKDPHAYSSSHLSRSLQAIYVNKFQQMGGMAGQRLMQKNLMKASRADATGNNLIQEPVINMKQLIKFMKKAITILGFSFFVDNSGDHRVWMQVLSQNLQVKLAGQDQQAQKDQRLIEYVIDQLSIVVMNDLILPKLSISLLVCFQNIIDQVNSSQESLLRKTMVSDYLIYLNTRIAFPYMLSKSEMADPFTRFKANLHRMTKSLRDIFKDHFHTDDLLYVYYMLNNQDFTQVKMQIVVTNMLQLLKLNKSEETLNSILTLVSQKIVLPERDKLGKDKNKELRKREKHYSCFVDCLSAILVWSSHSVYDRNCEITIPQSILESNQNSGLHHFIWNRNLITISQQNEIYQVYVRNPVFNYHAEVKTFNMTQQISNGDEDQISILKRLIKREQQNTDILQNKQEPVKQGIDQDFIKRLMQNDNTLMALIEPGSLLQYKKQKDLLLCEDDQTLRNYIQILDMIQPKDCYQINVLYIPKQSDPINVKQLLDFNVNGKRVSKAHLYFLSMLGQITSSKEQKMNHKLYLKNILDDKQESQLIINEDNLNYMVFLSNVLNYDENFKKVQANNQAKVCIIYNESNIDDFTKFDPHKIYLIFSKPGHSRQQSQVQTLGPSSHQHSDHKLQRLRSEVQAIDPDELKSVSLVTGLNRDTNMNSQPSLNRNQSNHINPLPHMSSTNLPTSTTSQLNQQQNQLPSQIAFDKAPNFNSNQNSTSPIMGGTITSNIGFASKMQKEKKFENGFYCDQAIIQKQNIGEFVKKICILSDMADRRQRYGKECIISNLIQRGMKIKEIKEKKINNAKFTTILKQ
eukprot:403370400